MFLCVNLTQKKEEVNYRFLFLFIASKKISALNFYIALHTK
jgi:hypothetical protein